MKRSVLVFLIVVLCVSAAVATEPALSRQLNLIIVSDEGLWRQNNAGIAISTSAQGYAGVSNIADLEPSSDYQKISMNFKNTDIRILINVIQKMSKVNIVACKGVIGKVKQVRFAHLDWPVALAALADSMGYSARFHDGVVFVGSADDFKMFSLPEPGIPSVKNKISVSFKDAAIADVLKVSVARGSVNILFDRAIAGHVNIVLKDVSEATAVKAITRSNGFDCLFHDGVWFVGTPVNIERLRQRYLSNSVRFNGGFISLDFRDTDIRLIYKIIAKHGKIKIDLTDQVQGKMTIRLTDQPCDKVAAIIAWNFGLDIEKTGDGILVK